MSFNPVFIWCFKSMTNFMTHKKIIDSAACFLPHRESKNTGMYVKASSLHLLVFHHKVFGGKKTSKLGFDFVVDRHRSF
jgi:hypothetical protein